MPYDCATVRPVHATNRWRVAVEGNRYSVPPRYASSTLTLKLYAERLRLFAAEVLVAEHPRSYERGRDFENPDHARELLAQRGRVRHQGLLLAFLRLSPQAQAYHDHLAERRLNARHHVQKIVALSEIYGVDTARAIDDAHALGATPASTSPISSNSGAAPARARRPASHSCGEALELELPPPDLSLYDQS